MKKINWKMMNFAFWLEIILCYVLPYKVSDNFKYEVGFPVRFISVYNTEIGINPLMSMHLNPMGLLINGVIIYLIISALVTAYSKFKHNRQK